jgi:hypothetical protein
MRTTLDIDDDVLQAAKEIAGREKKTAGQVISALARSALAAPPGTGAVRAPSPVYGFRPFPSRAVIVTNELIDSLREDDVY